MASTDFPGLGGRLRRGKMVKKVLHIQNEMAAYFHTAAASGKCHLRLGGSSFFLSYVYPPVIRRFRT